MLAIRLPEDIESRLNDLASKTGRTKTFYAKEAILEHIDEIELCYFAGGEPMLTEEHFLMLEEFIRRGKRPVLRYNTNASQLKYKKYDILELWKHFDKVEVSCSVDHFGERAEWLRKGTNWGTVENNLLMFRDLEQVEFSMNTVFSMFNYPMIGEFYQYLKDKGIVRAEDWYNSLYLAVHPSYYSAKSLPKELKIDAAEKALKFADKFEGDKTSLSRLIRDAVNFANEDDTWADNKSIMLQHTASIDNIREEIDKPKPVLTFDDTEDSPVIYGQDLQIPAFIRRQHD